MLKEKKKLKWSEAVSFIHHQPDLNTFSGPLWWWGLDRLDKYISIYVPGNVGGKVALTQRFLLRFVLASWSLVMALSVLKPHVRKCVLYLTWILLFCAVHGSPPEVFDISDNRSCEWPIATVCSAIGFSGSRRCFDLKRHVLWRWLKKDLSTSVRRSSHHSAHPNASLIF